MQVKKFQRTKEDFVCENCGSSVKGSGYTNHCLNCLWSKHVDVNPGDRQADCQGMMQPVDVILKEGNCIIVHQCKKCRLIKNNKVSEQDNFDVILRISNTKECER